MPTSFTTLAKLCGRLEFTTKRNDMVSWVASFLLKLDEEEVEPATLMLISRALPRWDQRVLEVSWATLNKTIKKVTNANNHVLSSAFAKTGDVGDATKIVFERGKTRKQTMLFQSQLTILDVRQTFEKIAETIGERSREKKERLLGTLLGSATPLEAKYLVRILLKEMRTGFHEGLMEQAVAEAFKIPLKVVQTASMLTGDIGSVATLAKLEGKEGLLRVEFKIFRPIKPMLAQMAATVDEVLKDHGGQTALEYKLDGARVQIHKSGDTVKIFSRRLKDVTRSLPEIVQKVRSSVKAEKAVLEGEVIAVGKDSNPMPFQHLMRRFTRIREIQHALKEMPIQLYLFDALYIDGVSLINEPYNLRRHRLTNVAGNIPLTKQIVTSNAETAEHFMKEAIEAGHEGLMAKKSESPYTPGIRGKGWFKIKETLEPLDLVIVAAEYGYGRRHGWLSDYCLAARDTESGDLLQVGKTFKGLTDAEIIKMTERLEKSAIGKEGHRVVVTPKIIVEVTYNEIQRSSTYKCGMALRFARISRIRNDKNLEAVDSIQKIRKIYEEQFEKKDRYP